MESTLIQERFGPSEKTPTKPFEKPLLENTKQTDDDDLAQKDIPATEITEKKQILKTQSPFI